MARNHHSEESAKDTHTGNSGEKDEINEVVDDNPERASNAHFGRRSFLKAGAAAGIGVVGTTGLTELAAASIDKSSNGKYNVWKVTGKEVYDLSDGEKLSNILVDQTAEGASLTIRSQNKKGWTVKNVGFRGVGQDGEGSNSFQFQVSTPSGGRGLIENIWSNGKARNGQPASKLGGIYIRPSHKGHIDIRHTYIEGFGNNAVYASAVGKDGGSAGSVTLENCYHRDNTVSQFRIGSPKSIVRNCVGVVNDPNGKRGQYPSDDSRNARCVWGKHYRNQRIENSAFYLSPNDVNPDSVFEARYIDGRSGGEQAVVNVSGCDVNANAPQLKSSTSNATVKTTNLGTNPTVTVIGGGGVPLSPKMAASGKRSMPPELPGADGGSSSKNSTSSKANSGNSSSDSADNQEKHC
ncbi:hypothetical protein [Halocatena pleomorpha]|uniref:Twin-arginine translocation signal domain-containing protein n=1 Tax=Halocatena pleomorpha TaxID=1785090 RepID=A0A3P3R8S2_9EURY|nr:hypothetical protein [Halocatena pleomorpha]RRJ29438.1 hypothetical protein EIK79_12405 [Halocatena pleomorpha]